MVERPHTGPLPRAHAVAHGSPPLGDGSPDYPSVLPERIRRRYALLACLIAALVVVAVVAGSLR